MAIPCAAHNDSMVTCPHCNVTYCRMCNGETCPCILKFNLEANGTKAQRSVDQWDVLIEHIDVEDELKDVFHALVQENKRLREPKDSRIGNGALNKIKDKEYDAIQEKDR